MFAAGKVPRFPTDELIALQSGFKKTFYYQSYNLFAVKKIKEGGKWFAGLLM
jgi:hypothetical protein